MRSLPSSRLEISNTHFAQPGKNTSRPTTGRASQWLKWLRLWAYNQKYLLVTRLARCWTFGIILLRDAMIGYTTWFFSPHTVIVFSITKLTWQLLAGRYYQDANLIFTRCLDLKTCIKKNDHDSLTDFQKNPRFWMDFGRKTLSQWLGFLMAKIIDWKKITRKPAKSWRSWLLQANVQNYLLIELNLREDGVKMGENPAESKGEDGFWRRHTNDGRWWRWTCWRRASGTHLLMEQKSTTICLYVYSRVTCLIYRYKMI